MKLLGRICLVMLLAGLVLEVFGSFNVTTSVLLIAIFILGGE